MAATIHIDTREFEAALREYAKVNKRDWRTIVNTKALDLAYKSLQNTPKVRPSQVVRELFRKSTRMIVRPNGKVSKAKGSRLVYRIINATRKRRGERPIVGSEMAAEVQAFVGKRRRSVAYLKAGWIPTILRLNRLANRRELRFKRKPDAQVFGKNGTVRVTGGELHPAVESVNFAFENSRALSKGVPALQSAMALVSADMREYIARKMTEANRKHGFSS